MVPGNRRDGGTYFTGIDLVRFATALMVALYHLGWSPWQAGLSGDRLILQLSPPGATPLLPVGDRGQTDRLLDQKADSAQRSPSPALLRVMGLTTYPLYLLHYEVGAAALKSLLGDGLPAAAVLTAAIALALAIVGFVAVLPEPWLQKKLKQIVEAPAAG